MFYVFFKIQYIDICIFLHLQQTTAELEKEGEGLEAMEERLEVAEKELRNLNEARDHVLQLWESKVMTQIDASKC